MDRHGFSYSKVPKGTVADVYGSMRLFQVEKRCFGGTRTDGNKIVLGGHGILPAGLGPRTRGSSFSEEGTSVYLMFSKRVEE